MPKGIVKKNLGGRPSKYNEQIVQKLEEVLKRGATIDQACSYALIPKQTYYNWVEAKEGFLTRMEQARDWLNIEAKTVISDKITKKKDDYNARWWLEKTEFKNNNNTNVQTNIQVVMPDEFQNKYATTPSTETDSQ